MSADPIATCVAPNSYIRSTSKGVNMTDINRLLNTTSAGLLAQKLDAQDGNKNGEISASIWNEFVKDKGGKEVREFISVEDAMNSITKYVIKNAKTLGKNVENLAQEWINAIPAASNESTESVTQTPPEVPEAPGGETVTAGKEKAAQEKGLRPTYNSNFYYSETEKEHYKWDSEKQTFIKYPNIAFLAKDGSYRREYKNSDGSRRSINYSKNGYPTKMEARNSEGKAYLNKTFAAKKLGLRETLATQTRGVYYDEQTKMHYKWNEKTHAFDALDKNIKYVKTDGTEHSKLPKLITTVKDKKTGKLISRTEDFGIYAYTYDANGNLTKAVFKDADGNIIEF